MKSSSVRHPDYEPLVVCRQWQIEFCDDNQCAAMLLAFFEYWHNIKLEQQIKNSRQNDVAEMHGENRRLDESCWQFHNEKELEKGLLNFYKRQTISKAILLLVEKGVITIGSNPSDRYKFDKTRWFLFHPEIVNEWIDHRPVKNHSSSGNNHSSRVKNHSSSFKNNSRQVKNHSSQGKNHSTRTEITTETTPETSLETSAQALSHSSAAMIKDEEREREIVNNSQQKNTVDQQNQSIRLTPRSAYDLVTCLEYVESLQACGRSIPSPEGLARTIWLDGSSDPFIERFLNKKVELSKISVVPETSHRIKFSDDPCISCYGTKGKFYSGRGFKPRSCDHCLDENGKPSGLEPLASFSFEQIDSFEKSSESDFSKSKFNLESSH